jgi:hypothetical protein
MISDSAVVYEASRFQLQPENRVLVTIYGSAGNQFLSTISDSEVVFVP